MQHLGGYREEHAVNAAGGIQQFLCDAKIEVQEVGVFGDAGEDGLAGG